jgi:hypothetical protein
MLITGDMAADHAGRAQARSLPRRCRIIGSRASIAHLVESADRRSPDGDSRTPHSGSC